MDWPVLIVGSVGAIALLAAWGWLAWAWMTGTEINGRTFTPAQLASIAALKAAAPADFFKQPQTLADLAAKCPEALVRAVLTAFSWSADAAMSAALTHRSEKLIGIVKRHFGLTDEWVENFLSPLKAHFALPQPDPDVSGPG